MRQGAATTRLIQGTVALLLLGAGAVWGTVKARSPADANTLSAHLGTLRSTVSEALALIEAAGSGRLTNTFFRTHFELLTKDVEQEATSLAKAKPEPRLESHFAEGAQLAGLAADRMRAIARPELAPDSLEAHRSTLLRIRDKARALEEAVSSLGRSERNRRR